MKALFTFLVLAASLSLNAQTLVNGSVKSTDGQAIVGANVVIVNSYDGAS